MIKFGRERADDAPGFRNPLDPRRLPFGHKGPVFGSSGVKRPASHLLYDLLVFAFALLAGYAVATALESHSFFGGLAAFVLVLLIGFWVVGKIERRRLLRTVAEARSTSQARSMSTENTKQTP